MKIKCAHVSLFIHFRETKIERSKCDLVVFFVPLFVFVFFSTKSRVYRGTFYACPPREEFSPVPSVTKVVARWMNAIAVLPQTHAYRDTHPRLHKRKEALKSTASCVLCNSAIPITRAKVAFMSVLPFVDGVVTTLFISLLLTRSLTLRVCGATCLSLLSFLLIVSLYLSLLLSCGKKEEIVYQFCSREHSSSSPQTTNDVMTGA